MTELEGGRRHGRGPLWAWRSARAPRLRRFALPILVVLGLGLGALHSSYPLPYIYRVCADRGPDFYDFDRFPARAIAASESPGALPVALDPDVAHVFEGHPDVEALETMLEQSETTAFLVLHEGRLVEELYFQGHDRESVQNTFSVSKSLLSALVGLSVRDGALELVTPISALLPELGERDQRFEEISIEHLLDMRSGIRYSSEVTFPFVNADNALIYYHPDLESIVLRRTTVASPTGEFQYNNYNPPLLGIALRRATGMPVAEYLERELWGPMGAAYGAGWTVDERGLERMESGFHARARDLARFGQLYLDGGVAAGRRVLPADWVLESTRSLRARGARGVRRPGLGLSGRLVDRAETGGALGFLRHRSLRAVRLRVAAVRCRVRAHRAGSRRLGRSRLDGALLLCGRAPRGDGERRARRRLVAGALTRHPKPGQASRQSRLRGPSRKSRRGPVACRARSVEPASPESSFARSKDLAASRIYTGSREAPSGRRGAHTETKGAETMSEHLNRGFIFMALVALLLAGSIGAQESAAERGGDDAFAAGPCTTHARLMRKACRADRKDTLWVHTADCEYVVSRDEEAECRAEADEEADENWEECNDIYDARRELCDLLGQARFDMELDPEEFVDPDDVGGPVEPNPYWPITAGATHVIVGEGEVTVVSAVDEVVDVGGLPCRVIRDLVFEESVDERGLVEYEAIEVTQDWYAQHEDGDIVYCGENTYEIEDGLIDNTDGSFANGTDRARAGFLVRAFPVPGDGDRQEMASDEAEDYVEYVSLAAGPSEDEGGENPNFPCDDDCLQTFEVNPRDPGEAEYKYYLAGAGFVLATKLEDGEPTGEREEVSCIGDSIDVIDDPACNIEDPDELREALCYWAPESFCDDD